MPSALLFREARRADVPAVVALLLDDALGANRELAEAKQYYEAFETMRTEAGNTLIVGEDSGGRVVATYQLTFITGLSLRASRRAQVESVRVAREMRGHGLGAAMMADAEARARAAGCKLLQLTTHTTRNRARDFYDSLGYQPTHVGYKYQLD
ncbi:MAG: GNAT family N-acetyltransferase [Pseudomonadota bacterium]